MKFIVKWTVACLGFGSLHGYAQESQAEKVLPDWKFGGDVRLRYEIDTARPNQLNRQRGRLRLRLTAEGPIGPDWDLGFRVRTGDPHTPYSGNIPLFNSLGEKETFGFNLDQAYLHYHPQGKYGFQLGLGKSPKFFGAANPYDNLMWASDYAPLGVWAAYEQPQWWVRAGYFRLKELPCYVDTDLASFEASYQWELSPDSSLNLEVGYHDFATESPARPFTNRGNQILNKRAFLSDFNLLEPRLTYNFQIGELPASASLYYIHNFRAVSAGEAFSFGMSLGRTQHEGDWSIFGRYQMVGQDAVFSPVAQDDFSLATNFRGLSTGFSYQVDESCRLDAWMLTTAQNDPSGSQAFRYRLDWNFKL